MNDRKALRSKAWRVQRRAAGLCVDCPAPAVQAYRCSVHGGQVAARVKRLVASRLAQGLCARCGARLGSASIRLCADHFAEYQEYQAQWKANRESHVPANV